jgi:hypothetical protein
MDQAATHEGVTSAVMADLVSLGRSSVARCPHADELARALAIVSQCYSVPVPSSAASAIQKALADVSDLLQHHRLYEDNDTPSVYTPVQSVVLESGLRLLWTHVTTYQLHAALIDLVRTIDFMPRAVAFWKQLRRRTVRELIQRGPMQWLLSRAQRITVGERIRSLEETLEAHLVGGIWCMEREEVADGVGLVVVYLEKDWDVEGADNEVLELIRGL